MRKFKYIKTLILAILLLLLPVNNVVDAQQNSGQIEGIIAESAIVMDMDTGEVIAEKNGDKQRPVASTIKLLTSLIFAENTSKTEMIPFTEDSLKTTQTALNNFKDIKVGEEISSNDLMKAVMILSANDAAYLMADSVAGNTKDFIDMMNERAKSMGLKNTKIVNPSGLETDALNPENKEINLSSAYDLAVIATEAYKNEWIRDIISEEYKDTSVDLSGSPVIIESRNILLGEDGNLGGKTGNEIEAGHCFVGFYEREGRNLVTVALNSQYGLDGTNVFEDTKKIVNYGYSLDEQILKKAGEELTTIELEYKAFGIIGPKKTIEAPVVATEDIFYYKNKINDKNINILSNDETKNAWEIANKEINISIAALSNDEEVMGKVNISKFDLLRSNVLIYGLTIVSILAIIVIIYSIIRVIKNRKKKRNNWLTKRR